MIDLILASSNPSKLSELTELLPSHLFSLSKAPNNISVVEDGETFFENARKKAEAYHEKFRHPILSDDSGLMVKALEGKLGVHTARYGGEGLTDRQRALRLLDELQEKNREAQMICVLCFFFNPTEFFFFEGRMDGVISPTYRGEGGFGYDPVFIPSKHEGKETLAEISEWKKHHSHRACACGEAAIFFKSKIDFPD